MCYKKTLLISAMIGIFVGLQIRYAPQSKELFAVSAQAEENSNTYRLDVGVRVLEKRLISDREKIVEQVVCGIARNTLTNMDFGYKEKGLPFPGGGPFSVQAADPAALLLLFTPCANSN